MAEGAFAPCDAFAAAVTIRPAIVNEATLLTAEVELGGEHSRGAVFFDWLSLGSEKHNVELVRALDQAGVEQLLVETFG